MLSCLDGSLPRQVYALFCDARSLFLNSALTLFCVLHVVSAHNVLMFLLCTLGGRVFCGDRRQTVPREQLGGGGDKSWRLLTCGRIVCTVNFVKDRARSLLKFFYIFFSLPFFFQLRGWKLRSNMTFRSI